MHCLDLTVRVEIICVLKVVLPLTKKFVVLLVLFVSLYLDKWNWKGSISGNSIISEVVDGDRIRGCGKYIKSACMGDKSVVSLGNIGKNRQVGKRSYYMNDVKIDFCIDSQLLSSVFQLRDFYSISE